jgi:hypothetical protein
MLTTKTRRARPPPPAPSRARPLPSPHARAHTNADTHPRARAVPTAQWRHYLAHGGVENGWDVFESEEVWRQTPRRFFFNESHNIPREQAVSLSKANALQQAWNAAAGAAGAAGEAGEAAVGAAPIRPPPAEEPEATGAAGGIAPPGSPIPAALMQAALAAERGQRGWGPPPRQASLDAAKSITAGTVLESSRNMDGSLERLIRAPAPKRKHEDKTVDEEEGAPALPLQCARHPLCVRGHKHGGKGGPCKIRGPIKLRFSVLTPADRPAAAASRTGVPLLPIAPSVVTPPTAATSPSSAVVGAAFRYAAELWEAGKHHAAIAAAEQWTMAAREGVLSAAAPRLWSTSSELAAASSQDADSRVVSHVVSHVAEGPAEAEAPPLQVVAQEDNEPEVLEVDDVVEAKEAEEAEELD